MRKAAARVDLNSLLLNDLLFQVGGMTDNVFNNLFIRAKWTGSHFVYSFAPWDMDMSWGLRPDEVGGQAENWLFFPVFDRLLALDALNMRQRLAQRWQALRASTLDLDALEARVEEYTQELYASRGNTAQC